MQPANDYVQLMPFPRIGHRYLNLIDESSTGTLTRQLLDRHPIELKESLVVDECDEGAPVDLQVTAFGVLLASENGLRVLSANAAADFQSYPASIKGSAEIIRVIHILRMTEDQPSSDGSPAAQLARTAGGYGSVMLSPQLAVAIDDAGLAWSDTTAQLLADSEENPADW